MRAMLALFLMVGVAGASKGGKTGASGRKSDCNECHDGGDTPTVTLSGPTTLAANGAASYRLTISGGAAVVGGLDVALDSKQAGLAVMRPGTHVVDGELTHLLPLDFEGGVLVVDFVVVAPPQPGTLTVYAAGNSCNGDDTKNGDAAATTSLKITVTGAATGDGGAPPGSDGGTSGVGGGPTGTPMSGGCNTSGAPVPASGLAIFLSLALLLRLSRRPGMMDQHAFASALGDRQPAAPVRLARLGRCGARQGAFSARHHAVRPGQVPRRGRRV